MDGHTFLKALATVICVAAVMTVLFARLRLPVVLGHVLAGLVVGPYIPIPLVADTAVVKTLSELGVTLLMFSLGLDFSLRKLVRVGPTAGLIMIIEVSTMMGLGYFVGRLLGWQPLEAIFTGAIVSISSTMIIAKSFSEQRMERGHVELVFGILVFEDLMAILLLAALTTLSTGSLSAGALLGTAARLVAFLLGLLAVGILLIPRLVRTVAKRGSAETLLLLCIGLCFAVALLAQAFGYSVALGAFICGSLVAESGASKRIEPLLHPLRDLFGAIFFVSVGMSINPKILLSYWREGALLTGVVIGGKIAGVSLGALLTGHSLRGSVQAAMALAQIGEFSFILAGLGAAQGATREFLYPVAVGVSVITALLTPFQMRASLPVATYLDRRLPHPLQHFLTMYAAWVERLRSQRPGERSAARRLAALILVDDVCLAGLYIGAGIGASRLQAIIEQALRMGPFISGIILAGLALVFSIPFWVGLVRTSGRLGQELAARVIAPPQPNTADLGAAPRRALALTLHILVLLVAGAPLFALTQLFLPSLPWLLGVLFFVGLVAIFGVAFWRSTTNLFGHARAGAQAIVEVLAEQSHSADSDHDSSESSPALSELLSGLGTWTTYRVAPSDPCVGKTLAQLNLRGLTGATVLAVQRKNGSETAPSAQERLRADDVLVLLGNAAAVQSARQLLSGQAAEPTDAHYEFFAVLDR